MTPARIILLVVAIVAGGLAAFLATRGDTPRTETVEVTKVREEGRTGVLVASRPIGVGERLNPSVLEWQDWPEGAVRPEYVSRDAVPDATEKLTGAVARFEFFPGEPIREAKLARSDQGYLSAVISPGMRAVSIDVSTTSGAGGFIVPNDRVDVVLTRKIDSATQSETVLRNVKVLAMGERLGELGAASGNPGEAPDPREQTFDKETVATLELTPGQAEVLVNAAESGELALSLRSVVDFAEKVGPNLADAGSSAIRMIRYGKSSSVIAGGQSFRAARSAEAPALPRGATGAPPQDNMPDPDGPYAAPGDGDTLPFDPPAPSEAPAGVTPQ